MASRAAPPACNLIPVLRRLALIAIVCVGISATALAATASAPSIKLYHGARPVSADGLAPDVIVQGPDGNLWFTESDPVRVGRLDPKTGAVKSFSLPNSRTLYGLSGISSGPGDYVWVAAGSVIYRIKPRSGAATPFTLPSGSSEAGIVAGPDGTLWFTDAGTSSIDRLVPSTGAVTAFAETGGNPDGITTGPDGDIWFTDGIGSIGSVDPSTGAVTQYPAPAASCNAGGSGPAAWGIAVGRDHDLYFTTYTTDELDRFNPSTHAIKQFCLHQRTVDNEYSIAVTAGPDGNIWATTESINDRVWRLDPSTGKMSYFALPAGFDGGGPGIAAGPGRTLWVTLPTVKGIARLRLK